MPIYEYKCKKCGKEFEMFQGIADPAAKSCKFCKGSVHKTDVPLLLPPEGERLVCHGLRRKEGARRQRRKRKRAKAPKHGEEPTSLHDQN